MARSTPQQELDLSFSILLDPVQTGGAVTAGDLVVTNVAYLLGPLLEAAALRAGAWHRYI